MKINQPSDKNILTLAKIGEIAEISLIHKFPGGNEYESLPNSQKNPVPNKTNTLTQSPSNENFLKKNNQTNNDNSFSFKRLFNTFVNSVIFEGKMPFDIGFIVDKYYFNENGQLNTVAVIKMSIILLFISIVVISIIYSLNRFSFKGKIPSKSNENVITLPNDEANKNNLGDKEK